MLERCRFEQSLHSLLTMKKTITLLAALCMASMMLQAQSSLNYSLGRPNNGGDLKLLETDFNLGVESVVDSYTAAEIDDYDPGSTTFDAQRKRFITLASDLAGNVSIIGLNAVTGNIDYSHTSTTYELFSIEYYDGKGYSMARLLAGGELRLVETDLSSGLETEIGSYPAITLDDYDPGATTFDHQNGRFLLLGSNLSGIVGIYGINAATGNIDYTHASPNYELFSIEYHNNKAYSLARPSGGGDLKLLETSLSSGNQAVIDSYPAAELDDYDPGATSFDHAHGRFTVLGSDLAGVVSVIAIDIVNGDIDYSFASAANELFSIETDDASLVGIIGDHLNEQSIHVFPNPAQNWISFVCKMEFERFEICNSLGQVVISGAVEASPIDVSQLAEGAYWIRLINPSSIQSQLFIKN